MLQENEARRGAARRESRAAALRDQLQRYVADAGRLGIEFFAAGIHRQRIANHPDRAPSRVGRKNTFTARDPTPKRAFAARNSA